MNILLTTNQTITINDLADIVLIHPLVNYILSDEFTITEISNSTDLQNAINNSYVTISDDNGNPILLADVNNMQHYMNKDISLDEDGSNETTALDLDTHLNNTSTNPHNVQKDDIGLTNVPNLNTTDAYNNEHTHTNKSILDNITNYYTTAEKNKLALIESGAKDDQSAVDVPFTTTTVPTDLTEVDTTLDHIIANTALTQGTGLLTDELLLSQTGANELTIAAGVGIINSNVTYEHISWNLTIENTSSYSEGTYYVYLDTTSTINYNNTKPNTKLNILLGFFYHDGNQIGMVKNDGRHIHDFATEVFEFIHNLGVFIYDGGGLISESSDLSIVSTQCKIQNMLYTMQLTEVTAADRGTKFFAWHYSTGDAWALDYMFLRDGLIQTKWWNDVTKSHGTPLSGTCTFTNGSNTVTTSIDLTSVLSINRIIWKQSDSAYYGAIITNINATTITLDENYRGTNGTAGVYCEALTPMTADYYVKHLVLRTTNDAMHIIYGQEEFATEDEAIASNLPGIPEAINDGAFKMSYVIIQQGDTTVDGNIYDIRPLPFHETEGGSTGSSSGGGTSDHGELTGLADDDHLQYLLTNGARVITSKMSYNSHPTFVADTELIDKKYSDNAINAITKTDIGLGNVTNDAQLKRNANDFNTFTEKVSIVNNDKLLIEDSEDTGTKKYLNLSNLSTLFQSLNGLQVLRTTDFSITISFTDVTFDTTDTETDTDVLEHDDTNTERLLIKEDGLYLVYYLNNMTSSSSSNIYSRVYKNGTTIINGSSTDIKIYASEKHQLGSQFITNLSTNDYITLQLYAGDSNAVSAANVLFGLVKLDGIKGSNGINGDIIWQGTWTSQNYTINSTVEYNGSAYICISNTISNENPSNTTYWDLLVSKGVQGVIGDTGPAGDLNWQGTWISQNYVINDTVEYNGSSYVCTLNTISNEIPTNGTYWNLVAVKGADGSGISVNIQNNGSNIPNTPHSTINFNTLITATDQGSGIVNINTVEHGVVSFGATGTQTMTNTNTQLILNTTLKADTAFVTLSGGVLTFQKDAEVLVSYSVFLTNTNTGRATMLCSLQLNSSEMNYSQSDTYSRGSNYSPVIVASTGGIYINASDGDTLEVFFVSNGQLGTSTVGHSKSWITIKEI